MLNFSDYLRRRAYESILLGVQQAMDTVEEQRMFEAQDLSSGLCEVKRPRSEQLPLTEQPTDGPDMPCIGRAPAKLADSEDRPVTAIEEKIPEPRLRAAQRRGAKA